MRVRGDPMMRNTIYQHEPIVMGIRSIEETSGTSANSKLPIDHPIIKFVKFDYLGHRKLNHVEHEDIFADQVDYYKKGELSRQQVLQDKARYYSRWPNRKYEMLENTLLIYRWDDFFVSFEFLFSVASNTEKRSGRGRAWLDVRLRNGHFEISVKMASFLIEAGSITSYLCKLGLGVSSPIYQRVSYEWPIC